MTIFPPGVTTTFIQAPQEAEPGIIPQAPTTMVAEGQFRRDHAEDSIITIGMGIKHMFPRGDKRSRHFSFCLQKVILRGYLFSTHDINEQKMLNKKKLYHGIFTHACRQSRTEPDGFSCSEQVS